LLSKISAVEEAASSKPNFLPSAWALTPPLDAIPTNLALLDFITVGRKTEAA